MLLSKRSLNSSRSSYFILIKGASCALQLIFIKFQFPLLTGKITRFLKITIQLILEKILIMNNGRWCIKPTWNHLSTYSTFHCWSIILWMTSVYCVHESKYHDWCIKIFATSCMIIFNWLFGILMVQNIPRCKKSTWKRFDFNHKLKLK